MKWRREKQNLDRPMTCECVGNGNAEWYCEYVDMCKFNNEFYLPGVHWTTTHKDGYEMKCTCKGEGNGKWECKPFQYCKLPNGNFKKAGTKKGF